MTGNDKDKVNYGKFDPKILDKIACPVTKHNLTYDKEAQELISEKAKLAFPIRDGIPIMLIDEAREKDWNRF